jgi:hypothetical protein
MTNPSPPEEHNSELDSKTRTSGHRIEKIFKGVAPGVGGCALYGDKGLHGETLRPSERENCDAETFDAALASDATDTGDRADKIGPAPISSSDDGDQRASGARQK